MQKKLIYICTFAFVWVSLSAIAKPNKKAACADIEQINITDHGLLQEVKIQEVKEKYQEKCMTADDIKTVLRDVSNDLIESGYVTSRVYVEPKKSNDKVLNIGVTPGKVGESDFLSKGSILNMRDVEQEVEQVKRMRGYNAQSSIRPGTNDNESDVELHITKGNMLGGSVSVDNHGTKSNGINQGYVSLQSYNAIGIYDILTVDYKYGFNDSAKNMASETLTGGINVPYGYWLLKLHMSYFDYQKSIPGQFTDLQYTGSNYNYTGDIERLIHRNKDSKTHITGSLIFKDSSNYMKQNLLQASSRKLSVVGFKASHNRTLLGGSMNASLGTQRGVTFFGAKRDNGNEGAKAQFMKYFADASYAKALSIMDQNFIVDSSIHAQASPDKLFDSEQVGIGGMHSVRGFRETQFAGETGWYIVNNFAYTLPNTKFSDEIGNMQLYTGFDYGHIKKNQLNKSKQNSASGLTFGIRNTGKPVTIELAYEKPLHSTQAIKTNDILYFKLRVDF